MKDIIGIIALMAGVVLVLWLSELDKKYGYETGLKHGRAVREFFTPTSIPPPP